MQLSGNATVRGVLLLHLKGRTSRGLPERQVDGEVAENSASLLPVETAGLQEDGTAPNTASPGWDVGAAGSSAVSPEAPSAVASLTAHKAHS